MVTPGVPPIPHVGGPILPPGAPTVLIDFLPAATVTDMATCVGPPDMIAMGSTGVFINFLPAARLGDPTVHGGVITLGSPTCIIGEVGSGGGGGGGSAPAGLASLLNGLHVALNATGIFLGVPGVVRPSGDKKLDAIVAGVNPLNGTVNCGNIIDAVVARLNGSDPNAAAPISKDGGWDAIEKRFNITMTGGHSFQDVFSAVKAGGDGTTAIVGMYNPGPPIFSHVVVMTNDNGTVGIMEAQGWGSGNPKEVITSPERANQRYNAGGGTDVTYGIIPKS
jgi:uncharacterized Zn-binding protein involved in type VI secretion